MLKLLVAMDAYASPPFKDCTNTFNQLGARWTLVAVTNGPPLSELQNHHLLHNRATHLIAKAIKKRGEAKLYVGVTSGLCMVEVNGKPQLARMDYAVLMNPNGIVYSEAINERHLEAQLAKNVCDVESHPESLATLRILVYDYFAEVESNPRR